MNINNKNLSIDKIHILCAIKDYILAQYLTRPFASLSSCRIRGPSAQCACNPAAFSLFFHGWECMWVAAYCLPVLFGSPYTSNTTTWWREIYVCTHKCSSSTKRPLLLCGAAAAAKTICAFEMGPAYSNIKLAYMIWWFLCFQAFQEQESEKPFLE